MKIYTGSDGSTIEQHTAFVLNGIAYPNNWLDLASQEDLAAHGISEQYVPDPVPPAPPEPATSSDLSGLKPLTISPRQARLALLAAGLLDKVNALVTATGGATQITWEYASYIERNDPLITALGESLGLTNDQLDALFTQGATL